MKRASKLLLCAARLLHPAESRSIHFQATRSSRFSRSSLSSFPFSMKCNAYNQSLFFSSTTDSVLDMFSSDDWPQKLEELKLEVTHESAMYVLKNLKKEPIKAGGFLKWAVEKNGFQPSSSIYSLMLLIYCSKDTLKEFWMTINEMKEKGYHIDEQTYRTIFSNFKHLKLQNEVTALKHFYSRLLEENAAEDRVKEVVRIIRESEWGEQLEKTLFDMEISVSDNFMLRVINELRGIGNSVKAYKFFKWVEECLGFKHNSVTYNGVLRILCWKDTITEFWNVIEDMKTSGIEMDIDTYVKVSRQLQKGIMLEDSVRLFEHIMDSSYKPSANECNYLLWNIATYGNKDLELVYRVVKKYEEAGNPMTKSTYNGIHRSLTSVGQFEEAEKIVETMKNAGFEPDNITYSQLLFGLCKAGRLDEAANIIDVMEEKGCKPDIKTWTILIKWHFEANETDKALLHFTKMMEKGMDPDSDLLEVLINGLLRCSRSIDAYKLLVELVQKVHLRPWQSTYKNLIQELLNERKLEEAIELLRMMKRQNLPTFPEPFVKYISKFGSVDDASEFLSALSAKVYPSVSAYVHVLTSFFEEGRHPEARDLLFKCPEHVRKHRDICELFGTAT